VDNECECEPEVEYGVGVSGPADPEPDAASAKRGFIAEAEADGNEGGLEDGTSFDAEFLLSMLCR
jgi:hypothetical protein